MSSTLSYTRKFIILKKDFGSTTKGNPKGHGKLEIKGPRGIVSISIENANPDDFYNVVFISNSKTDQILELGKIFTDDIGRGRGEYSFLQKDLSMEGLRGILIIKDSQILLGGYIDKEDGTIERYAKSVWQSPAVEQSVEEKFKEVFEEAEEIADEPVEELIEEPIEEYEFEPMHGLESEFISEEILAEEVISQEIITEDILSEEIATEEIPSEELYVEQIIEETNVEMRSEEEFGDPDYKTISHIKRLNQKNQTVNYVLNILRFFPYIDPFKQNLRGYNWWIVELDKENEYRSFLPYFSYITGGNSKESYVDKAITCNDLINKYQHYLFGLYNEGEEVKYFVYGIPGSFTPDEHPNGGADGFATWYPGEDIEGYWIIYIDPMTGKSVNPFNPMIPID